MTKSSTIVAFIIFLLIFAGISLLNPPHINKQSSSQHNSSLSSPVSFFVMSSFYEEREEALNRKIITVFVQNFHESKVVWEYIFDYGNKMPLVKEGYTAVFFFNNRHYTPILDAFTEEVDSEYQPYCVAGYWKYSNGTDICRQYPYKN
jgi:hypothetical protein